MTRKTPPQENTVPIFDALKESLRRFKSTPPPHPDAAHNLADAIAQVEQQLVAERSALRAADASLGDVLLDAMSEGAEKRAEQAQTDLAKRKQAVQTLEVSLAALRAKQRRTQQAAKEAAYVDRWAPAHKHADARRAALVRLQAALDQVAIEVKAANASFREINRAAPEPVTDWPRGMTAGGLDFAILSYLAKRTDNAIPPRTFLDFDSLAKEPGPLALHDQAIAMTLRNPPAKADPDGDLPDAA